MSLVPKLRFKAFKNDWKVFLLSNLSKKKIKKNKDKSISTVLTNSASEGIISQRDFFEKEIANKENLDTYYVVETNDFIYNPRISSLAPVGPLNRNHLPIGVMSPLYTVFSISSDIINLDWLESYFKSHKWHKYMYGIANYGARDDRMNITNDDFFSMPIVIPSIQEQEKIAGFLTAVDELIADLTKKESLLQKYKKGVMQKIFSQELRFKQDDGSDYPEWEEKKLGDFLIHKSKKNKDKRVLLVLSVSNKKGFVTQHEQFDGYQVASQDISNYKIVEKGDFAYNPSRINVGSIAQLTNFNEGIVSPMYVVFSISQKLSPLFLTYLLQTHHMKNIIKQSCVGSVRDTLNFLDMCFFDVQLPSLLEQQKIATFLSSIDDQIAIVQQQLDKTKQYKKALLQQLFI